MVEKDFEDTKSIYNEGLLQIQRLHNTWTRCNYYSTKGMFKEWRWELDVIWRELSYDTFKINNCKNLDAWDSISDVKAISKLNSSINYAFVNSNRADMYSLLNDKEIFLRILQHKVGKGGKYEDEGERGL